MSSDIVKFVGGVLTPLQKQALDAAGLVLAASASSIKIVKGGEVLGSMPLKPELMEALVSGKATQLMVQGFKDNLAKLVSDLTKQAAKANSPLHLTVDTEVADANVPAATTTTEVKASAWPSPFPLDQMQTGAKVPLINATRLYQPVNGSGGGSRYFAVALSNELKMAVRWKNANSLSVRFEGLQLNKYAKALEDAGLTVGGSHASTHLHPNSPTQARKAIGALMLAIPVQWQTPIPDLQVVYGKGNG